MTRSDALYLLPRLALAIALTWAVGWAILMLPEIFRGQGV